jgi:hypothetical protein
VAKTSSGAGLGVCGGGGGRPMGSLLWQNSPSSALSQLHHPVRVGPSPLWLRHPILRICVFGRLAGATFLCLFLRCFGAGVPSYFAGRGSLGAFPWFVPLTLWWVHCNTHSFTVIHSGHKLITAYSTVYDEGVILRPKAVGPITAVGPNILLSFYAKLVGGNMTGVQEIDRHGRCQKLHK